MAARVVAGARQFDSVGSLLRRLHWLPVHFQAQVKALVLTFKTLYGSGPGIEEPAPSIPSTPSSQIIQGGHSNCAATSRGEGVLGIGVPPVEFPPPGTKTIRRALLDQA